jgi:hypothetical protein
VVRLIIRLVLIVVGTAAYLGLAVLGWGGLAAFFSHPALIALAVAVSVLAGVSLFAGGNLSPGVREDRGNRWVIAAFALIGLLDAYLPAFVRLGQRNTIRPLDTAAVAAWPNTTSRCDQQAAADCQ